MDPLNERGDETDVDPDERIGILVDERYKILEAMASGSMGAVYKAERVPVGKLVAIKFLHASYAKDPEFLARFERETRVMSKLAHPNCVSVVDFGVWDGAPYLVMEYVAGVTLRALLDDEERIPVERALKLAKQMAAGLAHAHAQGITHRDVKPANIMISQEVGTGDHVRILDFGLARLRGNVGRDATQANVVVGTPNYMAPEQTVGGGTIDARTDIYALGVVLFEMIAGHRPFSAQDTLALLGMHRAAPIPKIQVPVPDGTQDLIEKAMAKSPDDRFQTAIEVTEAIDEIVGSQSRPVSVKPVDSNASTVVAAPATPRRAPSEVDDSAPRRPTRKSSSLGAGMGIIVLAGGAVAAWYFYVHKTPEPSAPPKSDAAIVASAPADARGIDAAELDAPDLDAPDLDAPALDAATADGSGSDDVDIEMDPENATNPDPEADKQTAEDEAEDAPETTEAAEAREPVQPVLAKTVADAVGLIKDGKRDLALASLNALWKKSPQSAYIPFLLGNLYNDKLWWSVAMDHYKAAIGKNGKYRGNAVLNRNVIRMLASPKTDRKAAGFLRNTIGKSSVPYLKIAAKAEKNDRVRKQAAALAKSIR